MGSTPQGLIIGMQHTSYSSDTQQYKHEKRLHNPSNNYGKYGKFTRETCAHILIFESHNASISAMLNLFHNIINKK